MDPHIVVFRPQRSILLYDCQRDVARAPPAFPHGPSRDPRAKQPLRRYRPPACAACPDRAPPRYAAHEQRPLRGRHRHTSVLAAGIELLFSGAIPSSRHWGRSRAGPSLCIHPLSHDPLTSLQRYTHGPSRVLRRRAVASLHTVLHIPPRPLKIETDVKEKRSQVSHPNMLFCTRLIYWLASSRSNVIRGCMARKNDSTLPISSSTYPGSNVATAT